LYYNFKKLINPLIIPSILIFSSLIFSWYWDRILLQANIDNELSAFIVIFPFFPYILFAIVAMLGARSKNLGLILISIILSICYFILTNSLDSNETYSSFIIPRIISFLLPINILLLSFMEIKKLKSVIVYLLFILIEFGIFRFFYYLIQFPESEIVTQFHTEFPGTAASILAFSQNLFGIISKTSFINNIPVFSLYSFVIVVIIMILKFLYNKDIRNGSYIFIIISVFLAFCSKESVPTLTIFFTTSGFILLIGTIEASFSMAYIDELTGLHGRRSLNETMSTLTKNYAIAMLDIDHFKQFNDKYGHKTGDQVLKMTAAKLGEVSGGAKSFRFGGEEFTTIFPGKTAKEAKPYMDEYRLKLENTKFIVRSLKRRTSTFKGRGKSNSKDHKTASVTVSIGIAEYGINQTNPEKVLKAADKILYKAKRLGRNRVEIQKRK